MCFLLRWHVLAECVGGRLLLLLRAQAAVLSGAVGGGGRPNRDTQISIPGVVLLLMWSGRGCCCNTTGRGVARVHDDVPRVVDSGTLHTTTQRMLMVGSGAGGGLCRLTDWLPGLSLAGVRCGSFSAWTTTCVYATLLLTHSS